MSKPFGDATIEFASSGWREKSFTERRTTTANIGANCFAIGVGAFDAGDTEKCWRKHSWTGQLRWKQSHESNERRLSFFVYSEQNCRGLLITPAAPLGDHVTMAAHWVVRAWRLWLWFLKNHKSDFREIWHRCSGASIPQQPRRFSPFARLPPSFLTPPRNIFWTFYSQFCAIFACFQWILEAASQW